MDAEQEMEELQLALEGSICGLGLEELTRVAEKLELNTEGLRKLQISRRIREKIELDLVECEDRKLALEDFAKMVAGDTSVEHEAGNIAPIIAEESVAESSQINVEEPKPVAIDFGRVLKRELKIHGQIAGEKKEGLSFVSLVRQVEAATRSGFKEYEVVEAVIRAVNPSLKLRSYLEMMPGLSLPRLTQILRAHYKQKSATELYQELSAISQGQKESPQDFLIRAMDLRQQVMFASKVTGDNVKYEPSLVQALFVHVVETGLQQEAVRAKLRPLLEKTSVSDEELMERINTAASAETERQSKIGVNHKRAQLNQVGAAAEFHQESSTDCKDDQKPAKKVKEAKPNPLLAKLEAVQADLASLKESFHQSQTQASCRDNSYSQGKKQQKARKPMLCGECAEAGKQKCNH